MMMADTTNSGTAAATDDRFGQIVALFRSPGLLESLALPAIGIALFLLLWQFSPPIASTLHSASFPVRCRCGSRCRTLAEDEHTRERDKAKPRSTSARRNATQKKLLRKTPTRPSSGASYTGKPTFIDQIMGPALLTVATGFLNRQA